MLLAIMILFTFTSVFQLDTLYAQLNDNDSPFPAPGKIIPNSYEILLKNQSFSGPAAVPDEDIVPAFEKFVESKDVNVTHAAPEFKALTIQIPSNITVSAPADVALPPTTRNTTIGDVRSIFRDTSGPAEIQPNDTLPASTHPALVCEIIEENKNVEICQPTRMSAPASTQTIPTGLSRVSGYHGHSSGPVDLGGSNIVIAVVDTGVNIHPDLNVVNRMHVSSLNANDNDNYGHGTHVAGIIGAKDNSIGVVGIAPGVEIWSIKVCDTRENCAFNAQYQDAFAYILEHSKEIDVVNISMEYFEPNPILETITKQIVEKGIPIVVAAGNHGLLDEWPDNDPSVISVGTIADSDGKCGGQGPAIRLRTPLGETDHTYSDDIFEKHYSNHSPHTVIAAPGVNILSTWRDGSSYMVTSGTSMAAPYVAGSAAQYIKTHSQNGIPPSPNEVKTALINMASTPATPCDGEGHGYLIEGPPGTPIPVLYAKPLHPE